MRTAQQTAQDIDRIENRWRYGVSNGDALVEQAQADVAFLVEHIGKLEDLLKRCRHDLTTYDGLWATDKYPEDDPRDVFAIRTDKTVDAIDAIDEVVS